MFADKDIEQELLILDHPSGLTPLELAFCRTLATGARPVTAFLTVWNRFESESIGTQEAAGFAGVLMKKPAIKLYVNQLIEKVEELGVLSIREAQMFLTRIITTPVGHLTEEDPLCQEVTTVKKSLKDGSEIEIKTVKAINKMDSLKTLGQINGWFKAVQVDHNHTGGVMLVPMVESLADWQEKAKDSQAALMADAIKV